MRAFISKIARLAQTPLNLLPNGVFLTGLGLIAYAVTLIYFPAGLIVGGVGLVLTAIDMRS